MARTIDVRDVFDILVREHRDLEALIWDLEWVAGRGDLATAAELVGELTCELSRHLGTDACFHEGIDPLTVAARTLRRTIEQELVDLLGSRTGDPAWMSHLVALRDLLAEHVRLDESALYPRASRDDGASAHDERERTVELAAAV